MRKILFSLSIFITLLPSHASTAAETYNLLPQILEIIEASGVDQLEQFAIRQASYGKRGKQLTHLNIEVEDLLVQIGLEVHIRDPQFDAGTPSPYFPPQLPNAFASIVCKHESLAPVLTKKELDRQIKKLLSKQWEDFRITYSSHEFTPNGKIKFLRMQLEDKFCEEKPDFFTLTAHFQKGKYEVFLSFDNAPSDLFEMEEELTLLDDLRNDPELRNSLAEFLEELERSGRLDEIQREAIKNECEFLEYLSD